jgi:peptidoglycan-N-acetylglucosamine deacetylase
MAHYRRLPKKRQLNRLWFLSGIVVFVLSSTLGGILAGAVVQWFVVAEAVPAQPAQSGPQMAEVTPALTLADTALQLGNQEIATLQQQQNQQRLQQQQSQAAAAAAAEQQRLTYTAPRQLQGATVTEVSSSRAGNTVALTFDDGPWRRTTDQVLDILKQEDIKATFFWIGQAIQNEEEVARRVVSEGHAIGNHTWHHLYHTMSAAEAAEEIDTTARIIYEATGARTALFRPPGGYLNNGLADYAKRQGQTVVNWSVSSSDTDPSIKARTLATNVLSTVHPGSIILMHDGGGDRSATVEALPTIIRGLKAKGYHMVTLPQLLEMETISG